MLEAKTELMLALFEIAEQTSTVPGLLDRLKHLDNFYGRDRTVVELRMSYGADAGSYWNWAVFRRTVKDNCGRPVKPSQTDPCYVGALTFSDGEWGLHS